MKINLPRKVFLFIEASRWPWQRVSASPIWCPEPNGRRYGWICREPMGRFGGAWNFAFGIRASESCVMLDLIFGIVKIRYTTQKMREEDAAAKARLDAYVAATRPQKVEALLNGEWSDKHGTGNSIG